MNNKHNNSRANLETLLNNIGVTMTSYSEANGVSFSLIANYFNRKPERKYKCYIEALERTPEIFVGNHSYKKLRTLLWGQLSSVDLDTIIEVLDFAEDRIHQLKDLLVLKGNVCYIKQRTLSGYINKKPHELLGVAWCKEEIEFFESVYSVMDRYYGIDF